MTDFFAFFKIHHRVWCPPPLKGWAEPANVVLSHACLCCCSFFSPPRVVLSIHPAFFQERFISFSFAKVLLWRHSELCKDGCPWFSLAFVHGKPHGNPEVSIVIIPTLQTGKPRCRKGNSWLQIPVCTNPSPTCCWLSSCTEELKSTCFSPISLYDKALYKGLYL